MKQLVYCELLKAKKSSGFRIVLGIVFLLAVAISLSSISFKSADVTERMDVATSGIDAFFVALRDLPIYMIIGVLLVSIVICGDFENRLIQAEISSGNSRTHVFLSKVIAVALLFSIVSFFYPFTRLLVQGVFGSFGITLSLSVVLLLLLYYLTSVFIYLSLLSICFLLAFVIQKSTVVIAFGILLLVVGSSAISAFGVAFPKIGQILLYTPFGMNRALFDAGLNPMCMLTLIGLSLTYLALFLGVTNILFQKAELK